MKRIIYLIALLLLMVISTVACVFLWTTKTIIIVKLLVSVLVVVFTIIIFKVITNMNESYIKELSKKPQEEPLVTEEKQEAKKLILCPKCYQAWDGEVCFHCGFKRELK